MLENQIKANARTAIEAFIKLVVDFKHKQFSELPKDFPDFYRNTMLSGGAILSMLNDEEPRDFDFYFKNQSTVDYLQSHHNNPKSRNYDPALVFTAINPETLHKKLDFMHRRLTYDYATDRLVLDPHALVCAMNKTLRYISQPYPIASLLSVKKYLERGWTIDLKSLLTLSYDLSQVDWSDGEQLVKQLTCVKDQRLIDCIELNVKQGTAKTGHDFLMAIMDYLGD